MHFDANMPVGLSSDEYQYTNEFSFSGLKPDDDSSSTDDSCSMEHDSSDFDREIRRTRASYWVYTDALNRINTLVSNVADGYNLSGNYSISRNEYREELVRELTEQKSTLCHDAVPLALYMQINRQIKRDGIEQYWEKAEFLKMPQLSQEMENYKQLKKVKTVCKTMQKSEVIRPPKMMKRRKPAMIPQHDCVDKLTKNNIFIDELLNRSQSFSRKALQEDSIQEESCLSENHDTKISKDQTLEPKDLDPNPKRSFLCELISVVDNRKGESKDICLNVDRDDHEDVKQDSENIISDCESSCMSMFDDDSCNSCEFNSEVGDDECTVVRVTSSDDTTDNRVKKRPKALILNQYQRITSSMSVSEGSKISRHQCNERRKQFEFDLAPPPRPRLIRQTTSDRLLQLQNRWLEAMAESNGSERLERDRSGKPNAKLEYMRAISRNTLSSKTNKGKHQVGKDNIITSKIIAATLVRRLRNQQPQGYENSNNAFSEYQKMFLQFQTDTPTRRMSASEKMLHMEKKWKKVASSSSIAYKEEERQDLILQLEKKWKNTTVLSSKRKARQQSITSKKMKQLESKWFNSLREVD